MASILSLIGPFTAHADARTMTAQVRQSVTEALAAALRERGRASLAVSGGSTPKALYEALSAAPLDWASVTVVLVDERWVDPGLAGSNETFVRKTLLQGPAAAARFVGLKTPDPTPQAGRDEAERRVAAVPRPFDLAILGLGPDGHTASWFPHAAGLQEAIAARGPLTAAITARQSEVTGPFTERLTLTRAALADARRLILLIKGEDKRRAFETAQGPGRVEDMPVRALIRDERARLETHWCP
ncbi:6-phosphogluconolactonase [Marinicauda algicola]|nr:6-phosphogluconolactonase [Marinicauda algicola]